MKKIKRSQTINITYGEKEYEVDLNSTPFDFIKKYNIETNQPVASVLNGHVTRMNKKIKANCVLNFIERNTYQGQKIYESTAVFMFLVAFYKTFPDLNVFIQHSIQQGIFAEVAERELSAEEIKKIEDNMIQMTKEAMPIQKESMNMDLFLESMEENERSDILNLFKYYVPSEIDVYELDGFAEFLYLPLLPNAKHVTEFQIKKYQNGIAIIFPDYEKSTVIGDFKHHESLFQCYREYHRWTKVLKVRTVGQLNRHIMNDSIDERIIIAEALHEQKLAYIASDIIKKDFMPKLILIAGPSSSGKTTFSKRLSVHLKAAGLTTVAVSLDNYFLERSETPKDEEGNYDFESLRAIDVNLFQDQIGKLLAGEKVELPHFDFKEGKKVYKGNFLQLEEDQIMIVEGIHGINPELTKSIEDKFKYRIYISPMTQLNIHRHDRVATSDTRLLRRIVRDSSYRGYSAADTLKQWRHVRTGEAVNIFPFQDVADATFNSALFYEMALLKKKAERELLKVERTDPTFAEAQRLLKFLSFFLPLDEDRIIPSTSIVREFIGGSSFKY